jgi:hypothetical protein
MNQTLYKKVIDQIYRRYPEFTGARPKVRLQKSTASQNGGNGIYLFTFQKNVPIDDNKILPRWMRVMVNQQGKILKVSTSR